MNLSWQLLLMFYAQLSTAFSTSSLQPRWSMVTKPQDQKCGYPPANIINSTGTNTTLNPFILPEGPLNTTARNWTWTVATTTTGPGEDAVDTVQQKLFLSVSPFIDLSSSSLTSKTPGCGVIFHGLNHAALVRGQYDTGRCNRILSSHCIRALQSQTNRFDQECNWNTSDYKVPSECLDYFDPNTVIQTFTFASSDKSKLCLATHTSKQSPPGSGDLVSSWGASPFIHNGTFISSQGLSRTPYDNLTTLISPIMVHLGEGDGQLFCIRSRETTKGSFVPRDIPGYSESPWWALPVEMILFCLLVGAALM